MTGITENKKAEKKTFLPNLLIFTLFFFIFTIGYAVPASSLPDAYKIPDISQHKQLNALLCGPASLEILFDFWGQDIDQKAIADVSRSSSKGTITWDMARAGHFSYKSAAKGSYFPKNAPSSGFLQRKLGYASFNYSSDIFWWDDLKALIASDIPVVLLMRFAPDDDTGHYRVIVGYDENKKVVYFLDPWDRDFGRLKNPDGTMTWTMDDFMQAWNYSKYGAVHPYWGAVIMPWSVNLTKDPVLSHTGFNVSANITYPCPQPFDCAAFPASSTGANITLPPGMHLIAGSPEVNIGNLKAGESHTVTWNIHMDPAASGKYITVRAGGLISGNVPDVSWPGVFYGAYSYTDEIGGNGSIMI